MSEESSTFCQKKDVLTESIREAFVPGIRLRWLHLGVVLLIRVALWMLTAVVFLQNVDAYAASTILALTIGSSVRLPKIFQRVIESIDQQHVRFAYFKNRIAVARRLSDLDELCIELQRLAITKQPEKESLRESAVKKVDRRSEPKHEVALEPAPAA